MHQLFSDSSHAMSRDGCRKEEGRSMLRFMICDDEPLQLSLLETYVREWAAEKKIEIRTDRFQNAEQLLFAWEEGAADIVLLDIDMPGMDGISLARRLRHKGAGVQILFVTGFADYALEGYEVEAVSYLIKPVEKGKLFACLDRAWERCGQEEPVLLVETPWGAARVKLRDICYLESDAHNTQVHCVQAGEPLRSRIGIRELEERIGEQTETFFKIHRSYLVNMGHVGRIARKEVTMDTGESLPVARNRWEALNQAYLDYYRGWQKT